MKKKIQFDQDEAILLLDAYLRITEEGQKRKKVVADLSRVLRNRALAKGLPIADSYRSVEGLPGQLRSIGHTYRGTQGRTTSLFDKTVDLYKNNYPEYERRLNKIKKSMSICDTSPLITNTAPKLMRVLENHKDGFRQWLSTQGDEAKNHSIYWNYLVKILEIAADYGYIDGSLNEDVLTRVETELFALPDFQASNFRSRGSTIVSLRKFIGYWNEKGKEDEKNVFSKRGNRSEENSGELLHEFDAGTDLKGTRPVRVVFNVGKTFDVNSWKELYVRIVQTLYRQFPRQFQNLLREAKGSPADFLDAEGYEKYKETYRYSIKRVNDNFYLNTMHSANAIVEKIQRWLEVCGLETNILKIYYTKARKQISKATSSAREAKLTSRAYAKKEKSASHAKKRVHVKPTLDAIREHFPNGFKFDKSTLALLEQKMGRKIKSAVIDELQKRTFKRKDGLHFLSESIIDPAREKELVRQVNEYLKKNAGFEALVLYDAYADALNRSCIRDVGDFEDWLKYFVSRELKFTSAGKFRIARDLKKIKTGAGLVKFLLRKIRRAANRNYGTLEESDIVEILDGFSLEFLSYIVKMQADDVFVREINETICFQTFEGLGVPGDFSEKLLETLEQIDELELTPSSEAILVLLSFHLKYNVRNEFGLEDDRSFRKLIESRYEGKEPRKWKTNVFGREEI